MLKKTTSMASPDVKVIEREKDQNAKVRVAAYCRVSTDMEVQKRSMEIQMMAYEKIIAEHPGWELAGIYADEGLSGTSVKRRGEFLRMIDDARAGKIDYILVKSVSRFARNTVDLLKYIRELKEIGVNVFFEKEHVDTGKGDSEFMISIFAAAAQEESISLSNNMKVGRRMRFAQGVQQWARIYGYTQVNGEQYVIVPEEAEIIRRIFNEYINGKQLGDICADLNTEGVATPLGHGRWGEKTVQVILHNEKYAGHMIMQKTYIKDPINQVRINNRDAKITQYYKKDDHTPIVDQMIFDEANTMLAMRSTRRGTVQYPFYGTLLCPYCGAPMVCFHCKDYYWTCGGEGDAFKRSERSNCPPYAVEMKSLERALRRAKIPTVYGPMHRIVESLTFPENDWNHLIIRLRDGQEKVVPITYPMRTKEPLLVVTETPYEWKWMKKTETRMTKFVNGNPIDPCRERLILQSFERRRDAVNNLMILPPEPYEMDVPRVNPRETWPDRGPATFSKPEDDNFDNFDNAEDAAFGLPDDIPEGSETA